MGHLRRHLLASIDVNKMKGQRLSREGKGHDCNLQKIYNRNSVLALNGAQISPHRHFVAAR